VPFLELDLIDPEKGISLGGCALHTFHPGGRAFDLMPLMMKKRNPMESAF